MPEGLPYKEQDPDDVHTPLAEQITDADVAAAKAARSAALGAAEAAVGSATAQLRHALTAWYQTQPDLIEQARLTQIALSYIETERDIALKRCVQSGLGAADVARKVGVRPQQVVLAMTRKD